MKKIFAVFLSVLFVMSAASLLVSAGPITQDSRDIDCLDFLDFSADTSYLWAKYNEETGEWEQNEGPDDYGDIKVINGSNYNQPIDENGTPIAPALHIYEDYLENTSWSITENGEVFLMGLVTEREAKAAADIASRVSGVKRVTTAFTFIK